MLRETTSGRGASRRARSETPQGLSRRTVRGDVGFFARWGGIMDAPGSAALREEILRAATLEGAATAKLEATMAAILFASSWFVKESVCANMRSGPAHPKVYLAWTGGRAI